MEFCITLLLNVALLHFPATCYALMVFSIVIFFSFTVIYMHGCDLFQMLNYSGHSCICGGFHRSHPWTFDSCHFWTGFPVVLWKLLDNSICYYHQW